MKSRRHNLYPAQLEIVFVYGTLKQGRHNNFLIGSEQFLGNGTTVCRFPLIVHGTLPYLLPFAGQGLNVHGELYRVSAKRLRLLDHLEGHPEWYRRSKISVMVEGIVTDAWAYFLCERWITQGHRDAQCVSNF